MFKKTAGTFGRNPTYLPVFKPRDTEIEIPVVDLLAACAIKQAGISGSEVVALPHGINVTPIKCLKLKPGSKTNSVVSGLWDFRTVSPASWRTELYTYAGMVAFAGRPDALNYVWDRCGQDTPIHHMLVLCGKEAPIQFTAEMITCVYCVCFLEELRIGVRVLGYEQALKMAAYLGPILYPQLCREFKRYCAEMLDESKETDFTPEVSKCARDFNSTCKAKLATLGPDQKFSGMFAPSPVHDRSSLVLAMFSRFSGDS